MYFCQKFVMKRKERTERATAKATLPKLVFIGSGNLATQLALVFSEKGYSILQVYSRTEESAATLSGKINCPYTTDIAMLDKSADVYICALKDSVLQEVLSQADFNNKLIIHTAGSVPMDILSEYSSNYGVFYPLQTFSKNRRVDFSKIPVFIESNNRKNFSLVKLLADSVSKVVYKANSEHRKKLHLAAVFACNFTNHLYAIAAKIIEESGGFPMEVLLPLIDETAAKVHTLSPAEAQTGPAVRHDKNVIDGHLEMLESDKELRGVYEVMSGCIGGYYF